MKELEKITNKRMLDETKEETNKEYTTYILEKNKGKGGRPDKDENKKEYLKDENEDEWKLKE